jgi:hypothetical protein
LGLLLATDKPFEFGQTSSSVLVPPPRRSFGSSGRSFDRGIPCVGTSSPPIRFLISKERVFAAIASSASARPLLLPSSFAPLLLNKRPLLRSGNSACGDVVATDAVPDLSMERSFRSKERVFAAIVSLPSVQPLLLLILVCLHFPSPLLRSGNLVGRDVVATDAVSDPSQEIFPVEGAGVCCHRFLRFASALRSTSTPPPPPSPTHLPPLSR